MATIDPSRTPAAPGTSRNGRKRPKRRQADRSPADPHLVLSRNQARTLALQVLFEVELTGHDVRDALANAFTVPDDPDDAAAPDGPAIPPDVQGYAERLVHGTLLHMYRIDPLLTEAAPNFAGEQTPAVDRNVLRMAAFELAHHREIPPREVVFEAVELAKHYGGENSGRFVNGVLRTIQRKAADAAGSGAAEAGEER